MPLVVVNVSNSDHPFLCSLLNVGLWRVDDLLHFARLADYNYDPLVKGQSYVPPNKNNTGDMDCDCNTVLYR